LYVVYVELLHRHTQSFPRRRSSDLDAVEKCISLRSKLLTKAFLFPVTQETSTPYLSGYAVTNKTLVYFCSNFTCQTPVEYQKFTDRKSTRLNSSHVKISYADFCLKK